MGKFKGSVTGNADDGVISEDRTRLLQADVVLAEMDTVENSDSDEATGRT